MHNLICLIAGKQVADEELENMLEQGNAAVFTQGVRSYSFSANSFL